MQLKSVFNSLQIDRIWNDKLTILFYVFNSKMLKHPVYLSALKFSYYSTRARNVIQTNRNFTSKDQVHQYDELKQCKTIKADPLFILQLSELLCVIAYLIL